MERVDRRLVLQVERAEAAAKAKADAARNELINHEIRARIEGDRTVSDMLAPRFALLRERLQRKGKNGADK